MAAELLADGAPDPVNARSRAASGAHPDLTWVAPSGAHEILVSDIDGPVIAAASKTPFEASRRVFVIERVDELGDEAANRMLKTLEEPASFVHLILLTDRLVDVLPTIRSRCQLVRFDAAPVAEVADELSHLGVSHESAIACARLALGDAERARELASPEGSLLRAAAEAFARATLAGEAAAQRPWAELLTAVKSRGEGVRAELEGRQAAEVEMYPRKERKRVENEWGDRIRRARRRVETSALDLELQLVALWFADVAYLGLGCRGPRPQRRPRRPSWARTPAAAATLSGCASAIELVEETRQRFQLNVTEELACEALAYRLEQRSSRERRLDASTCARPRARIRRSSWR